MIWEHFKIAALTRHKKVWVIAALTVIAYYAAISRTQAFPWLLASLLTSTLISGYIWPRWLIRNISVTRRGPERGEEGEHIVFDVEVKNHGIMPRFMIQAVDQLPFLGAASGEVKSGDQVLGLLAYIHAGATQRFSVSLPCEKRGFYQLGPVRLASSFPLGLLEARQNKNGGTQSLIIYPDIFPIISLPLLGTPSEIHRGGFLLPKGAGSAEFSGLREYHRGDNPRHIHWPTTARVHELMVKEFEPLASASLHLVMDLSTRSNVGLGKQSSFEYAVRIAASISRYATNNNMPLRLSPSEESGYAIGSGSGEAHFKALLDYLAIIEADSDTSYASVIAQVATSVRYGQTVVVFLSEPTAYIAKTIEAIAMLQASGVHLFAILLDRDSFNDLPAAPESAWSKLYDLGITYIAVKKGDDLTRLFNP